MGTKLLVLQVLWHVIDAFDVIGVFAVIDVIDVFWCV